MLSIFGVSLVLYFVNNRCSTILLKPVFINIATSWWFFRIVKNVEILPGLSQLFSCDFFVAVGAAVDPSPLPWRPRAADSRSPDLLTYAAWLHPWMADDDWSSSRGQRSPRPRCRCLLPKPTSHPMSGREDRVARRRLTRWKTRLQALRGSISAERHWKRPLSWGLLHHH